MHWTDEQGVAIHSASIPTGSQPMETSHCEAPASYLSTCRHPFNPSQTSSQHRHPTGIQQAPSQHRHPTGTQSSRRHPTGIQSTQASSQHRHPTGIHSTQASKRHPVNTGIQQASNRHSVNTGIQQASSQLAGIQSACRHPVNPSPLPGQLKPPDLSLRHLTHCKGTSLLIINLQALRIPIAPTWATQTTRSQPKALRTS